MSDLRDIMDVPICHLEVFVMLKRHLGLIRTIFDCELISKIVK